MCTRERNPHHEWTSYQISLVEFLRRPLPLPPAPRVVFVFLVFLPFLSLSVFFIFLSLRREAKGR